MLIRDEDGVILAHKGIFRVLGKRARHTVLYGGRGGGKSVNVALWLLLRAMRRKAVVLCAREVQRNLGESVLPLLAEIISDAGWSGWEVQSQSIKHRNGSEFIFRGLSDSHGTARRVKSFHGADIVWVEEAQDLSEESLRILRPTVRAGGSHAIYTMNPRERDGAVYRQFVLDAPAGVEAVKFNYDDLPAEFRTAELDWERDLDKRNDPGLFPHTWLGEPIEDGSIRRVLPFDLVEQCIIDENDPIVTMADIAGRVDAGLDVADAGGDRNVLAMRRGPLLFHVEAWSADTIGETTRRAHRTMMENGVREFRYDAGGVGAGVKSSLVDIGDEHVNEAHAVIPYYPAGINFGASPAGAESWYAHRIRNKDHFARRNMQMAWALRLRAQRTRRLLAGEAVDPDSCLFIDPALPGLRALTAELSQPLWKEDASGRMVLDKYGESKKSPDLFDAVCLAFALDSDKGLRNG